MSRQTHETRAEWLGLMTLSIAHSELGQDDLARSSMDQAVALARSLGPGRELTIALINSSDLEYHDDNLDHAIDLLTEARDIAQGRGAYSELTFVRVCLAELRWRRQDTQIARRQVVDLIGEVLALREPLLTILQAEICAAMLAGVDARIATQLLGAVDAERDSTGFARFSSEQAPLDKDMEPSRAALTGDEWDHHYQLGRAMSIEDALAQAGVPGYRVVAAG